MSDYLTAHNGQLLREREKSSSRRIAGSSPRPAWLWLSSSTRQNPGSPGSGAGTASLQAYRRRTSTGLPAPPFCSLQSLRPRRLFSMRLAVKALPITPDTVRLSTATCSASSGMLLTTASCPRYPSPAFFSGTLQQDVGHPRDLRTKPKTRCQPQSVCLRQLRGIERVIAPRNR